jgi:RHS repeat-associated protein
MYYYVRNGQSDIIGILDSTGIQVVYYQYDSWGNPLTPTGSLASTIGTDNPFRYRGYYLDSETGLYYLNSRYYDSSVGRFINADGLISSSSSLLGTNMYGYCENNPISFVDKSGKLAIVDDAILGLTILVFFGIIAVQQSLKSPQAQRNLESISIALSGTLSRGLDNLEDSWNKLIASYALASSVVVAKSMSKSRAKIEIEQTKYDYWVAIYVSYGNKGTFVPTIALSYKNAIFYVQMGGSVFADSRSSAKRLARAVGNGAPPIGPEIHGAPSSGYWYHYHGGNKLGGHIFYVTWP